MSILSEMESPDSVYRQNLPYQVVRNEEIDSYEEKVVQTYCEEPEHWRKAIGDTLLFQFGVYEDASSGLAPISTLNPTSSLDRAGVRYFEQQLFLAGVTGSDRPAMRRILDIGCGWGYILKHLAERYPECRRLDGVNVSGQQLQYCSRFLSEQGLQERINLFQCNAQNIDLLPDSEQTYDLVIMRGVISHFPDDLFERVMGKLWQRVSPGGTVIISDNLYNIDLETYKSDTVDTVDRLACNHRKTPDYFFAVLEKSGFIIHDKRVLPSDADATKWLLEIRNNIEKHFPDGATGALEELRVMCENLSIAIVKNKFSIYSTILKRP